MFCPQCGTANDGAAKTCSNCNAALPEAVQAAPTPRLASGAPDDQEAFYKAILGPDNQDYYLRQFSRFDRNGSAGPSWNWPALFMNFYWLIYRKMWLAALVYALLPLLLGISLEIIAPADSDASDAMYAIAYLVFLVGVMVLFPMYANALYYRRCRKRISATRASSNDVPGQLAELSAKGGTSFLGLIILIVIVVLIGTVVAIAIPTYQQIVKRTHLSEAASRADLFTKGRSEQVRPW